MAIHHNVDGTALNYALDFSGGTATTVTFNEDMDIKQIDSEVTPVVEEVTVPEYLQNYIDYEAYGRDIALGDAGAFTDYGYVYDNQR